MNAPNRKTAREAPGNSAGEFGTSVVLVKFGAFVADSTTTVKRPGGLPTQCACAHRGPQLARSLRPFARSITVGGILMTVRFRHYGAAAVLLLGLGAGCHTMHTNSTSDCSRNSCADNAGSCADSGGSCSKGLGSCFGGDGGPRRWSQEWYCAHGNAPAGARQKCHKCKQWPPFPRPTGPKQEWSHRFHVAHYWPYPYNTQDLQYLRTVSNSQVANGWTQEMTLFPQHFEEKTNNLNHAGQRKLKWIVQIAPEQRRQIWIQVSDDKKVDEARIAAVQKAATNYAFNGTVPPVALRVAPVNGRPTDEVNRIRQAETGSMPVPRIPFAIGGNGAASGAGGAGTSGGATTGP